MGMNGYINQIYKTFSQYGIRVLVQRSFNFALFKVKRMLAPKDLENEKRFDDIKVKLLTIYDKGEVDNISDSYIDWILSEIDT